MSSSAHPLPSSLEGRVSQEDYGKWLERNARRLFRRDRKGGMPYAVKSTRAEYKTLIHLAVVNGSRFDPYTGEELRWELIGTRRAKEMEGLPDRSEEEYSLMPTADHRNPYALDFEVCSLRVNSCKNYLTPEKFVSLCCRVYNHRQRLQ